jgi:hypothetical protein
MATLGCAVVTPAATTVAGLGALSPAPGYATCAITCPVEGQAFDVSATNSSCIAKANAAEWAALGCVVASTPTATTLAGLGALSPSPGYATCAITCPVNGQAFTVTATNSSCTAKANAAEWATLGCAVITPAATTVAGLGALSPAPGYATCAITCPVEGQAFVVTAMENQCIAKANAAEWAALGCVATAPTAITVSGIGAQSAAAGYSSCVITCPVKYQNFVVAATKLISPSPVEETDTLELSNSVTVFIW